MSDYLDNDELIAHVKALSNRTDHLNTELEEVRAENDRLRDRVAELERIIAPDPEATAYEDMSREQKVFQLREKLVRNAKNSNGHDRMKYGDVQRFFDKHPSPGHTYDLMQLAANADGFNYDDDTGEKRVTVKLEDVNDDALIRAANKTPPEQPA